MVFQKKKKKEYGLTILIWHILWHNCTCEWCRKRGSFLFKYKAMLNWAAMKSELWYRYVYERLNLDSIWHIQLLSLNKRDLSNCYFLLSSSSSLRWNKKEHILPKIISQMIKGRSEWNTITLWTSIDRTTSGSTLS